ncbi:MAG: exodeoxyribonuclease VII small subunit [Prevotellaceae bacterium]|jgi:exodeoxyribonuclease VII small subunit|nr:exodeoxyribonuclease VII small subunit [Prevotellaceae bacterium]
MRNKKLTYTEAITEIKSMIERIENSEPDIDALNKDIERAVELIEFCKSKLHVAEENINKILEDTETEIHNA